MKLNERCTALAEMKKKIDLEGAERAKVKYGSEYLELTKRIEELVAQQEALLSPLPNSQAEYDALVEDVINLMNAEQVFTCGNVSAKFKEKNEVNTSKVLQVLGGDVDLFVQVSNVTQAKLKEFAKTSGLRKELMDCVETVSREIVDVVIEQPFAA